MTPTGFFDVAQLALDCVCASLDAQAGEEGVPESYGGCPCLSYVSAGEPAVDCCTKTSGEDCSSGVLTVHTESIYASNNFPEQQASFSPCEAASWVADIVVTLTRCHPTQTSTGKMPKAEALTEAALVQGIDTYAVLQGLGCCLSAEAIPGKRKRRVQIVNAQALVSDGGCSVVEVRAAVEIASICGCSPAES